MTQADLTPQPRLQAPFSLADGFDALIVGSGARAEELASLLRQAGFDGSVAIVSDDVAAVQALAPTQDSAAKIERIANHKIVAVDFIERLAFDAQGVALAYVKLVYAPELDQTAATRSAGWAVLTAAGAATQDGVPVDRQGRSAIDHVYVVGNAAILVDEMGGRVSSAGVTASDVVADLMTSLVPGG